MKKNNMTTRELWQLMHNNVTHTIDDLIDEIYPERKDEQVKSYRIYW